MLFGPKKRQLISDSLLAVDVETTGLKPAHSQLVSVGWVPVNGRVIDLAGAEYFVLRGADVGESATLHGVTDDEVTSLGREPAEVLEAFLAALDGRKLLAHFAQMETGFLGKLPRMCAGPSGGCTTVRWLTPSPWSGATWNAWAPTRAAKTCVCPGCGSVITCRCTRTTTR